MRAERRAREKAPVANQHVDPESQGGPCLCIIPSWPAAALRHAGRRAIAPSAARCNSSGSAEFTPQGWGARNRVSIHDAHDSNWFSRRDDRHSRLDVERVGVPRWRVLRPWIRTWVLRSWILGTWVLQSPILWPPVLWSSALWTSLLLTTVEILAAHDGLRRTDPIGRRC